MKPIVKLSCFFTLFSALFCGFAFIINMQFSNLAQTVEDLHDHPMAVIRSALSAARDMVKIARNINEILLIRDKETREREVGSLVIYEKSVARDLDLVEARIKGEEGVALVAATFEALKKWQPIRDKILDLVEEGKISDANLLGRTIGDNRLSDVDGAISKVANYAIGQGMSYHAEGIENLRKARVILFITGFIVLLLFLVLTIAIGYSILRPQRAVEEYLVKATENGLDVLVKPNVKAAGSSMGIPLLKLQTMMEEHLIPTSEHALRIKAMIETVINERKDMLEMAANLEQKAEILESQSSNLIHKISPVIDTVATFSGITKQIENDFNLMLQISTSQQLLINSLDSSGNDTKKIALLTQEKSAEEYLKNSIGIISNTSRLSHELVSMLKELSSIAENQACLDKTIEKLRENLASITHHLSAVNAEVSKLAENLKSTHQNTSKV